MITFRFSFVMMSKDVVGEWRTAPLADMLEDCKAFAVNSVMFAVEFR